MTREEQVVFITEITEGLKATLLERVKYVPEHWNGRQLRMWMRDMAGDLYVGPIYTGEKRQYDKDRLSHPGL